MLGLFDPPDRRIRDEREIRYFYLKYGADAPTVLSERADDSSLSSRDWRRLARRARRQQNKWMDELNNG
jgi:hypothetical protein